LASELRRQIVIACLQQSRLARGGAAIAGKLLILGQATVNSIKTTDHTDDTDEERILSLLTSFIRVIRVIRCSSLPLLVTPAPVRPEFTELPAQVSAGLPRAGGSRGCGKVSILKQESYRFD
jgi:hypothetical protein